jgi:uncharacterized protein (TIGR02266 family)
MAAAETHARDAERARYFAEVDVLKTGTPKPLRLWGENLSEDGIFLQTSQPWTVGERLALRIPIEEERVVIRQAEVVWVRPFEPINVDGRLPGIGVRFLSVDPPYRAAIRQLLLRVEQEQEQEQEQEGALHEARDVEVPPPPSLAEVTALAPNPPTPSSAFKILAPLSLPPTAEPEYTLKGWVLEKAPRALRNAAPVHAHVDASGPVELGVGDDDESARWQIGGATIARPRASRAPVAVDTSVPHRASLSMAASLDADVFAVDAAALAHADDAGASMEAGRFDTDRVKSPVDLSFDDEGPASAPFAASRDDDDESTASLRRMSTHEDKVPFTLILEEDRDVDQGTFVPRVVTRRSPMNLVFGALVVALGAVGGVFLGLDAPTQTTRAHAETGTKPPRSVDEAERALHALYDEAQVDSRTPVINGGQMPATTVAAPLTTSAARPTEPSKKVDAPAAQHSTTTSAAIATAPTASEDVAQSLLPRKPTTAEPVMTNSIVTAGALPEMLIERGRVTLPFEAGTVKSAFTLSQPPRVVVDLVDAKLAAFKEIPVSEKGIAKIRFGRPNPDTVRVVVELDVGASPHDVTTLKRQGSLAIAWR